MIKITTPGKLILLGEYAILEGKPAIVTAVDKFVHLQYEKHPIPGFIFNAPNLGIEFHFLSLEDLLIDDFINALPSNLQFIGKIFQFLFKQYSDMIPHFSGAKIRADSSDFYRGNKKMGFGSSAAVVVSIVALFLKLKATLTKEPIAKNEIFHLSRKVHHFIQSKMGSGIDIAVSTFGGIMKYIMPEYQKEGAFIEHLTSFPLSYGVVWTGSSTSTADMLKKVLLFKKTNPTRYWKIMDEMGDVSTTFYQSILSRNLSMALNLIEKYYFLLQKLGELAGIDIISREHQKIAELVKNLGGVYKSSGAGGGDIGVFFSDNQDKMERISQHLLENGIDIVKIVSVKNGVKYENSD